MEIGSEYNLSLSKLNIVENNLFKYLGDYNCVFTDSGRSALKLVGQFIGGILLPEFICEAVINCFNASKVDFYAINSDGKIDLEDLKSKINEDTKVIFIMHYFGVLQPNKTLKEIRDLADKNNIVIIEDTTHSLFSAKKTIGDYMITSVRKWMPLPNGGVLYSKKKLPETIHLQKSIDNDRVYGMILKELFLKETLDCNATYRNIFSECEDKIDSKREIQLMSDFAKFILSCCDVNFIQERRRENYFYLKKMMEDIGIEPISELGEGDCPFAFIIRVKNRDDFRSYLIEHRIYCAVHWPLDGYKKEERNQGYENAQTLISLPIDQRYGKKEMNYLADVIRGYGGELLF